MVITTAAIPGKKAPVIITRDMVGRMKYGAIIVDMAAESGGNCELTQAGEHVIANDVNIHGPLNLPSRMPTHASELYARTCTTSCRRGSGTAAPVRLERRSRRRHRVVRDGVTVLRHRQTSSGRSLMDGLLAFYIFMLAAFTGYEIIARCRSSCTPLMSGSNFIHGVVVVGAMIVLGNADTVLEQAIGFFAVALGAPTRRRLCGDRTHARHVQEKEGA